MTWRELFEWWNAIYSVPLLFSLGYLAISLAMGTLFGGHDVGHDADAGGDLAADHGVTADVSDHGVDISDGSGDADGAVSGDGAAEHGGMSPATAALRFIGAGWAPLSLIVQCLLIVWGGIGLLIHATVAGGSPLWLGVSVPVSLIGSVAATRGMAWAFWQVFRKSETFAMSRSEFVGLTGRVVYPVSGEEGTIHFRDRTGTLHRARARTRHEALDSGAEVIVVGYDPDRNVYEVDDPQRFAQRRI